MDEQYQKVRDKVEIQKIMEPSDSDEETQNAYQQLRPDSKKSFKDVIGLNKSRAKMTIT